MLHYRNLLPLDIFFELNRGPLLALDVGNLWGVDYSSAADDGYKIRASTGINASWTSPIGPMTFVFSQNLSAKGTVTAKLFDTLARQEGIDPLPQVDIETLEVGETFYVPGAKSLVRIVLKEGKKDLIQTPY